MFGGKNKLPTCVLNVFFGELISLLGKSDKSIDFVYGNGKCGRAIIVPQAKSQISFMDYARKFKWVKSMLEHVAGRNCDREDASEWLCYYLGKRHDASFTLALESLGYPLVHLMPESAAEAMWADANINITQQQILKKHLCYQFGKRIFIAENKLSTDCNYYSVPTCYGEYKYFKDGDKSQKAEKCSYWSHNFSLVVKKELE
jgi:hypothetical protein